MTIINETSLLPVRWTVYDADGGVVVPSTVRYRVDCLTTGIEMVAWTTVTPSYQVNVVIPATVNTIRNNANATERKRITFQADAGLSTQLSDYAEYEVTNNRFYT